MTLTLTVALVRATPAAVALTHFGAPAGAAAQPCAVTSVSFAATLARSEWVPFFSLAEAAYEPVAPVVAEATFFDPSRIVTAMPGAPTPAAEILPENVALRVLLTFAHRPVHWARPGWATQQRSPYDSLPRRWKYDAGVILDR